MLYISFIPTLFHNSDEYFDNDVVSTNQNIFCAMSLQDIIANILKLLYFVGTIKDELDIKKFNSSHLFYQRALCAISSRINNNYVMYPVCIDSSNFMSQSSNVALNELVPRDVAENDLEYVGKLALLLYNAPIEEKINKIFSPSLLKDNITVILTQYKRNTTLQQIISILRQSAISRVSKIIIYQNLDYVNLDFLRNIFNGNNAEYAFIPPIEVVKSEDHNYKYHGRFSLALLVDSAFVAIFDDDTIPQSKWLEYATRKCNEENAIIGATGVIIARNKNMYFNPPFVGDIEV